MKLVIARCSSGYSDQRLVDQLKRHFQDKCELDLLNLPPFEMVEPLRTVTAYRLIPPMQLADGLLCLDPWAAVIRHPKKLVWLTNAREVAAITEDRPFIRNLLAAGIREAKTLYVSPGLMKMMKGPGWKSAVTLSPHNLAKAAGAKPSPIARLMKDIAT